MSGKGTQARASWAIAALAAAAVVAGLAIGGGPMQARKERRDDARIEDLQRLATHVACLADESGLRRLPADLTPTPGCPGPVPLTDSRSGEPYRVEPLDAGKYRLCAAFELPQTNQPPWMTNRRDGDCIVEELPRPLRDDLSAPHPPEAEVSR